MGVSKKQKNIEKIPVKKFMFMFIFQRFSKNLKFFLQIFMEKNIFKEQLIFPE